MTIYCTIFAVLILVGIIMMVTDPPPTSDIAFNWGILLVAIGVVMAILFTAWCAGFYNWFEVTR